MDKETTYYFTIEAFGKSGVSVKGKEVEAK